MDDIATAPRDGTWVWLFGEYMDEPKGVLAFWGEGDDWFDSEAANNPVTTWWTPTHWMSFEAP